MIQVDRTAKAEYGDFQTPLDLATQVCKKLVELNIRPTTIIEPTCGTGNFLIAAAQTFPAARQIIGVERNPHYLQEMDRHQRGDRRIETKQGDFFQFDWLSLINEHQNLLVLGNLPWVTNSQQGTIDSQNLPTKTNFQRFRGVDALTGKSNFDISEWMLIQIVGWLQHRPACLAMLCKITVARKLLNYIHANQLNLADFVTYKIDAKKYFAANVEACLLVCKFDTHSHNYFCDVFSALDSYEHHRIGYCNHHGLVRDLDSFSTLSHLYDPTPTTKWRSGIKHDCSAVMEFSKVGSQYVNGFGATIDLEETYLLPLLKGSDVAQNRTLTTNRFVLVTQKLVGESTDGIRAHAPKTWSYLNSHANELKSRKSKIYQHNPPFSVFGVGPYTFAPWKIAICGLYKALDFRLIGPIGGKPAVFDDTVYFLSFEDEQAATETFAHLTSSTAIAFYRSLIFWDEKRPIKASILNCLNLLALAHAEK